MCGTIFMGNPGCPSQKPLFSSWNGSSQQHPPAPASLHLSPLSPSLPSSSSSPARKPDCSRSSRRPSQRRTSTPCSTILAYTRGDKRKCLNNYSYRLATALTFGLTFPLANLASSCPCGVAIDALRDHFFLYSRATAERVFKHNTLLDIFNAIFVEVGITAATEVPLRSLDIVPPNAEPNSQRMDLFFTVDGEGGLCDVTVVHPCRPESSTPHHTQVNRSHARQPGGTAAAGAERDKDRKYGNNCRQKGYTFVLLAPETFGC
ncbi:unnamed protein product [Vitrella brassicaformis CCMP3155]|uniref:Uncharacterized protein n=1 Tax=Vitrella brassicaformis (strain CCMP3155) TaxID=1169540 RepID=A0A0G4H4F2_VITBC|nr:unnamed protein product [Vitrella brassicaformis CCMP3155]|eukprot:CEM38651.1 unnamed protein product [Vitrella brassicaformis CCMP3155]